MSNPINEGVNTTETNDERHSLPGHEPKGIDKPDAAIRINSAAASEEVARQIKAATDPLTKQLERCCDLMKKFRQAPSKRNEETSGLIQGPSKAPAIVLTIIIVIYTHHAVIMA